MSYECQGDYKKRMEIQKINTERFQQINESLEEIKTMMNDLKTIKQDVLLIKEFIIKKQQEYEMNKWAFWWK